MTDTADIRDRARHAIEHGNSDQLHRDLLAELDAAEATAKWLIAEEAYNSDSYSLKKEARALRKVVDEIGEILQEDPPLIPDLLNRWVANRRPEVTP